MQQGFPITIKFDSRIPLNNSLTAVAQKIEMWINFAALKNGWYADENLVLEMEFMLLLDSDLSTLIAKHSNDGWQIEQNQQFAILHDRSNTKLEAYIAFDPIQTEHFEVKLKTAITTIANLTIQDYGFVSI